MLLKYDLRQCLPSAEDLPDSDDTPVDNELQDLIPGLLKTILALIWSERMDWFFGVDMGIYYDPDKPAIVPDGFLSIGVPRIIDSDLRLSYVLWEEQKLPIMVLEVVSQTRRGEYTQKKQEYAELGILYYVIYNPLRKRKQRLEVYKLENGKYQLLPGEAVWLSELNLGIGREEGKYQGITREWLYWYDEQRKRYLTAEELLQQERERAEFERQRAEFERKKAESERLRSQRLEEILRSHGIDPNI
ncbi:Uma2 family endonuclease [Sphaerospermopsis sp. LEGE 08334]|jgi:Uma2 family endonuclease|uniref:Uma2 family endonuclease n=1 Tax=Sphaerospermopsis sp. LEGE 08334 TaxID=1828651 RepID=UPI00187FE88A|nr:Uma2 family endonuclease [Sphaerospermopsis sp. LEGE 08334]MBE9058289.1 Uma2 family endonuclease [Sphaerospermopsis sp. LEGE 08334]